MIGLLAEGPALDPVWTVVLAVVGAFLVVQGLVVFYLAQQLMARAVRDNKQGPPLGLALQARTFESTEGGSVTLGGDADRPTLVIFSDTRCHLCKSLGPELAAIANLNADAFHVVYEVEGPSAEDLTAYRETSIVDQARASLLTVADPGIRQRKFDIVPTPFALLLNTSGVIVSRGYLVGPHVLPRLVKASGLPLQFPPEQPKASSPEG